MTQCLGPKRLRQVAGGAAQQELAQQRVKHEHPPACTGQFAHEVIVARQIDQHAARELVAGQLLREFDRDPRDTGDAQQQALRRGVEMIKDLAGEVVEHDLRRRVVRPGCASMGEFAMLDHQHQCGGPAVDTLLQRQRLVLRDGQAPLVRHLGEFKRCQAQVIGGHAHHAPVGLQPGQCRRRRRTAGDDHAAGPRHFRQPGFQDRAQRTVGRHVVQIVDRQRNRPRDAREQRTEVAPREGTDVGRAFRAERGQRGSVAAQLARGVSEVVQERFAVVVVGIDLVPGPAELACLKVARRERRLAKARRRRDPGDGTRGAAVQACKKRLTQHDAADLGAGRLGKGRGGGSLRHGSTSKDGKPKEIGYCVTRKFDT